MPQYLITAFDYTDDQALDRRMATRPAHLEMVKQLKATGNFILGGAMLSPEDKMIGSTLVVEFENEAAVQQYLAQEPYLLQKVWEKVDVKPFRVATV
ncbi:YciI family protein [Rufibacter psychrotolerans]|uniref:YciI family protein n=1 Tax=Rufibacter psychrotolerans TaxID=2812556 RepID=UPI0019685689|nr:YciI family protein [Rufibacter sp. SYSU D00308]